MVLALREKQTVLFKIWTRVAGFIYYDVNHDTTKMIYCSSK